MSTRLRFTERTSARVLGTILDRDNTVVPASALQEATLTLWDYDTGEILNSRNEQDVLGIGSPPAANGVTIYDALQSDPDGTQYNFEWLLDPEDNAIVTQRRQVERHKALFRFLSSTTQLHAEFEIDVDNLRKVSDGSP